MRGKKGLLNYLPVITWWSVGWNKLLGMLFILALIPSRGRIGTM